MKLGHVLLLLSAAAAAAACSDPTEPTVTVPRQLYYTVPLDAPPWGMQLYAVALDGSTPVPLLSDSLLGLYSLAWGSAPWVSPDGRTIKLLAQASGAKVILNLDRFGALQSVEPFGGGDDYYAYPPLALSPDGSRQAWFSGGYLHIERPDGTELQRIYFDSLSTYSSRVAWSRDGRWLAYIRGLRDSFSPWISRDERLWVLRLSDGFQRPVTSIGAGRSAPAWSRDGEWLVFRSSTGINRVRADGSGPEQTVYIGATGDPSWSTGDRFLGFLYGGEIKVIHPDGSGVRSIPGVEEVQAFAWAN